MGKPLEEICHAIFHIVEQYSDVEIVYPVHMNPVVRETVNSILGSHPRIHLIDPVNITDMHNLLNKSYMVMTDSGGLQEEVPSMGKPVLVLRNVTERPEGVEAGTLKLAGTNKDTIVRLAKELLDSSEIYNEMAKAANPFGDGNASRRIANAILHYFGLDDCAKYGSSRSLKTVNADHRIRFMPITKYGSSRSPTTA